MLSKKFLRRFLFSIFAIVGCFLLVDIVIMPWYVGHGATQQVPSVIDSTLEAGRAVLLKAGLEPVEYETRPDPRAPEGVIVAQNPLPSSIVKTGRRIYLSVSGGEVMVDVPKLRGLSLRDARFALERAGLTMGNIVHTRSDTFFVNTVIDQSVQPGNKAARGARIGLLISQGKDPDVLIVPNLLGMTVAEAEKVLMTEGLRVGRITYQRGLDLVPNTIVDQYPRAGDSAPGVLAVDLFVVKLSSEEDVPSNEPDR